MWLQNKCVAIVHISVNFNTKCYSLARNLITVIYHAVHCQISLKNILHCTTTAQLKSAEYNFRLNSIAEIRKNLRLADRDCVLQSNRSTPARTHVSTPSRQSFNLLFNDSDNNTVHATFSFGRWQCGDDAISVLGAAVTQLHNEYPGHAEINGVTGDAVSSVSRHRTVTRGFTAPNSREAPTVQTVSH
jgi:hypothetical protein